MPSKKKLIIFSTTISNLKTRSDGCSVNDFKLILALKRNFNVIPLFRNYNPKNSLLRNLIAIIIGNLKILKFSIIPRQVFILRGLGVNILPCLLKKIMKHTIILSLGCTPVFDVEYRAFKRNVGFNQNISNLRLLKGRMIQYYLFRKANKFIVENKLAKKILKLYIEDSSKVYIIPYYVNHYFLKGSNPQYNPNSEETFKLGYTGRFASYDNLFPIIEAIKKINKNSLKVKMIFIGDGLTRNEIEKRVISENLINSFEFRGNLKHRQLAKSLNEFHCLMLPMITKIGPSTIAIKILEGVMNKKIIITTKSGYNKSLFPSGYDLILAKLTVKELIKAIKKVMINYEKYIKMMGDNQKCLLNDRSFMGIQNLLKSVIEDG